MILESQNSEKRKHDKLRRTDGGRDCNTPLFTPSPWRADGVESRGAGEEGRQGVLPRTARCFWRAHPPHPSPLVVGTNHRPRNRLADRSQR